MVKTGKTRAQRNRTLSVSDDEYLSLKKSLLTKQDILLDGVTDNSIINADFFDVIDYMADNSVDLAVIDPPYNLNKDFGGTKFLSMSSVDYATYLRSWFAKVCRKLKPNGSLYMCGDWKCTSSLQSVIEEELTVMNRITWQREKGRGAAANWKNGMEDIWFAVKTPRIIILMLIQ